MKVLTYLNIVAIEIYIYIHVYVLYVVVSLAISLGIDGIVFFNQSYVQSDLFQKGWWESKNSLMLIGGCSR